MPRPRFHKLPPEKRRAILDAAGREFGAHGFEQASLNAIIAAAGVSKGAFYYYFDDKVDLFATVFEELDAEYSWVDALDAPGLTRDNFWDRMKEVGDRAFEATRERPWLLEVGKAFYEVPPSVRKDGRLHELVAGIEASTLGFLARGQELGAVRTDLPPSLLLALLYGVDRAFAEWMPAHVPTMDDAERDALLTASYDLLRRIAEPR